MRLSRWYAHSEYMEFSKLRSGATYNLAISGVMNCALSDLRVRLEDLEINGPTIYGYQPLLEAIARLKGVKPESVVQAAGTSMANHLAMAALFAPGDEVLIEEPTYGLLLDAALYLGARVRRFQRRGKSVAVACWAKSSLSPAHHVGWAWRWPRSSAATARASCSPHAIPKNWIERAHCYCSEKSSPARRKCW